MVLKILKSKLSNPFIRFILLFSVLIFLWFTFYHFIYKVNLLFSDNHSVDLMNSISITLAKQSNFILNIFGYETLSEVQNDIVITKIIGNEFSHGVWIGEPCNGVKLFGVFSIFIIAFPGKIKTKFWFIPLGIIIIHLANVIRISILTIISSKNPNILDFNHNITFQVIVYCIILFLWFMWLKKYAHINNNININQH